MKTLKKKGILLIIIIGLLLIFTACGDDDNASKKTDNGTGDTNGDAGQKNSVENNVEPEEIELEEVTIQVAFPLLGEEYFERRFGATNEKMQEIGIDLEYIQYGSSMESLEELYANKIYPDIIIGDYGPIKELDIGYPLEGLVERHGFDLDRIDPSLLSFMRSLDDEGRVVGFPDGTSFWGLYYNKDVFDKLGKDYPDPDVPMTWPELMDLAKEMTVERDGIQYFGLPEAPTPALDQFAAQKTDPDTGEVLVEKNPVFKQYLDLIDDYYNIPGMDSLDIPGDPFVQEQTAAMVLRTNDWLERGFGHEGPEAVAHVDLAPMPVWPDMPTTTPARDSWVMVIPEYTEHKDEAFKVLETYLDKDIQIGMAKRMALQTPLTDPDVLAEYGSELETYEGKNVDAYFFGEAAVFEGRQSKWDGFVDINEAIRKIREENMDVVTALRELAEESEGKIDEAKVGGQSE